MSKDKKAGRNDPCPCGSGKKYKDCCLKEDELREAYERFRLKTDALYPEILAVNTPLLIKSNEDNYRTATFTDAMDFTVTCNALSLIRGVWQKSELSFSSALSARNIIEALVLLKAYEEGGLTEEDERLFLWQYALIEYDTYYQDGEKFASLLDLDDLKARYGHAKKIYNDAGVSGGVEGGKLRQIVHSRAPFMCKHLKNGKRIDFNKLLAEYLPEMLAHYEELSYYVHPNLNARQKGRGKYYVAVQAVVSAVEARYCKDGAKDGKNRLKAKPLSQILDGYCNPANPQNSPAYAIQRAMLDQGNLLVALAKDCENFAKSVFEELCDNPLINQSDNYLTRFFGSLPIVLYDITYDYILRLKESVKIKFKTVAEIFAHFDRVITATVNSRAPLYGTTMLRYYELIRAIRRSGKIIPDDVPPEIAENIFEAYAENYPQAEYPDNPFYKTKEKEKRIKKFMCSFNQPLGNLLDGNGQTVSFLDLVGDFYKKVYGDRVIVDRAPAPDWKRKGEPKPVLARDYMSMLYRESNNMSHGNGYLFFTNIGAFNDVNPVMVQFDYLIINSVKTVIAEVELWQKTNGKQDHLRINAFVDNLKQAVELLSLTAKKKYPQYFLICG